MHIELEYFNQFFEPIFDHLAADSAGLIRALAVKACFTFIQRFPLGPIIEKFMTFFKDPAWEVRFEMATHIILLQKTAGPDFSRDHLLPACRKLLNFIEGIEGHRYESEKGLPVEQV